MSDDRAGKRSVASLRRTLAIAAFLGAFLLASCQAAEDGGTVESAADEPTQAAAESVAAATAPPEDAEGEQTVTVSETTAGPALAGEEGMTLYVLFGDNEDDSGCIDQCEDAWPPFTIQAGTEVVAGEGVVGEFPTTMRPDGTTQATWFGRPLYYYAGDTSPGDANGHEVGDVWFVVEQ